MSSEKPTIDYAAMLADLEAKKAALEALIMSVKIAAASGALVVGDVQNISLPSVASTAATYPPIIGITDIPDGAFHKMTLLAAAKAYLNMVRRKQTAKEIADALRRGGMESTSPRFVEFIGTALERHRKATGEVYRTGKEWGLTDWLPPNLRANHTKQSQKPRRTATKPPNRGEKRPTGARAKKAATKGVHADKAHHSRGVFDQIEAFLKKNTGTDYSGKDIAEALGIKRNIGFFLGRLVKLGRIDRTGSGAFHARP